MSDGEKLLGDDGEHFNIYSIELIETRPSSLLRETGEESPHHLVLNLIGAIEYNAEEAECFREILR